MRFSTAVAALIGRALATGAEICGADHTSLLQSLRIKNHEELQTVAKQQKTSADHMFNQALAMLQDVKQTPGIAAFAQEILADITAKPNGFLAAIQAAHDADQREMDALWDGVLSAEKSAEERIAQIELWQSSLDVAATSHGTCREDEIPQCKAVQICKSSLIAAEAELETAEENVRITQKSIVSTWCESDIDTMDLSFREIETHPPSARDTLKTYLDREIIADEKRAARDGIQTECEKLEEDMSAQRDECNIAQVDFEEQSCHLETSVSHSLELSEQEVNAATTAYRTARTDVEAQEEIRIKEFLTLNRTGCLLDRIHDDGALPCDTLTQDVYDSQAEACHNIEVDTSSLIIIYNDVEDMPAFPAAPPVPCGADFLSKYAGLTDEITSCGEPQECSPCKNVAEPDRVVHFVYSQHGVGDADSLCLSVAKSHDGAAGCDPISETTCFAAAEAQYGSQVRLRRARLVVGSWNHVPSGCTVQSGGDWAAHWNKELKPKKPQSTYSLVLAGPDCAGNMASDATLQVCNVGHNDQRFGVHPCGDDFAGGVNSQIFVEEDVTGFAGVKIWRNKATSLAIDVDSLENKVDQWVWACPGSNAAKYWRPTQSNTGCWITPKDATDSWLRNTNLHDYDETDHALRKGWQLDTHPNGGWRWCGISEKQCQVACQDLGGCKAIYYTPNRCCFPSKSNFTGGSDHPGGNGGRKTYLQTENCA